MRAQKFSPQRTLLLAAVLVAAGISTYVQVFAHAIDYLAMTIVPSATFNGNSGNVTVTDTVAGGSDITFDLKYSIVSQGQTTTFPRSVTFAAQTTAKPAGASDVTVSGVGTYNFLNSTSTFTDSVILTAPSTPGAYTVKIQPSSGTGGQNGLQPGGGISVTFTVAEPDTECEPVATQLEVGDLCVLLHQSQPVNLTATLTTTSGETPIAGQTVFFAVDGVAVGSAVTDASGVATLEDVDVSGLGAGDHEVTATYAGEDCEFEPTNGLGSIGVNYLFLGFQQPINADGSSKFSGRTIPVKVKLADANGQPVTDADAHIFFALGTPTVVGTDAEPLANTNGDSGNAMRYDASANQYIFNWDIGSLANGTYTVRVDLGEGSCADPHTVVVSIQKKGK